MIPFNLPAKLNKAIGAAIKAGDAILEIYNTTFTVESKEDNSPLTLADKAAHEVIMNELEVLGDPILSEEGKHVAYQIRKNWKSLWIVDPLDGTKEFVKRNGEFTVNIAWVHEGYPVLGIIYVPVTRELFFASKGQGAYKFVAAQGVKLEELITHAQALKSISVDDTCRIVASRSHMSPETEDFISVKKKEYAMVETVSKGSSLKFCLIAEGLADVYPRFAPTMEWDTAAGQILVEEVGKSLVDCTTGQRMVYNRENLLNNWFLVE